ncbi:hypothetical protein AMTR_s00022p00226060 [Amborella trichopoda]|uniref:Cytochrome P450 n=1 Tax=Amborella trichopoda TaxID=13333 RepID=W1PV60_AMBTC|nr:hypothetical protein AMTR_s00022p00226060 [Amborella trichopoda]
MLMKARDEISSVVGRTRLVQESDNPSLPYLQAFVKETLRLHPTAPLIVRESIQDCRVGGYHIPKKSRVFVSVWAIGRDPNSWEDPLEFKPERFIGESGGVRGQYFQLLPFEELPWYFSCPTCDANYPSFIDTLL